MLKIIRGDDGLHVSLPHFNKIRTEKIAHAQTLTGPPQEKTIKYFKAKDGLTKYERRIVPYFLKIWKFLGEFSQLSCTVCSGKRVIIIGVGDTLEFGLGNIVLLKKHSLILGGIGLF